VTPAAGAAPLVLWDVDGTLVDSEPLHERVLLATLADEALAVPPDLHAQLLGLGAREIHALFRRRLGLRRSYADWLALRWQLYLQQVAQVQPRAGALAAFEAAEARGWRQAAVSNADRVIVEANLAAAGLLGRVAGIVAAEDVRHPKPHPEPYLLARRRFGPGAACAAVEDSAPGARAALMAGCITLFWPQQTRAPVQGAHAVDPAGSGLWPALRRSMGDPGKA
jgi:HAD superfamily hydrolase (TIGR01509 family)